VAAKKTPRSRSALPAIDLKSLPRSCAECGLLPLCLPASISREDLPRLDEVVQIKKAVEREQPLFVAGQPSSALYVVRSGSFKSYAVDGEGDTQVIGFHLPGEVIGLEAAANGSYRSNAEALERSVVCEVPFGGLEHVARELPGLHRQLMRVIGREVHQDQEHLVMIGRKVALERLAIFLHSLSLRLERVRRDPHCFVLPMSRRDLANYLGLVIETVSRLFSRLAELGVIEVERKTIRILDPGKLKQLAGEVCAGHHAVGTDA
jgi:CRP/FNR family transcriptional regulator